MSFYRNKSNEMKDPNDILLLTKKEEKQSKTFKAFFKEDLPIILSIITLACVVITTLVNNKNIALQDSRLAFDIKLVQPDLYVDYIWFDYQAFTRDDAIGAAHAQFRYHVYDNQNIMRFSGYNSADIVEELNIDGYDDAEILYAMVYQTGEKPAKDVMVEISRMIFSHTIEIQPNTAFDFIERNKSNAVVRDLKFRVNTIENNVVLYIPIMFRCSLNDEEYIYGQLECVLELRVINTLADPVAII